MPLASKHYIVRSHICRLQRPNNITLALDGSMFYAVGLVDFDKSAVVNPSRGRFGDWAECWLMGWFGKKVPCSSTCTVPFHSSWALPVPECPAVQCVLSQYSTIVFSAGIPHLNAWIPTPLFLLFPDMSGTYIFCGCWSRLQISVPRLLFFYFLFSKELLF